MLQAAIQTNTIVPQSIIIVVITNLWLRGIKLTVAFAVALSVHAYRPVRCAQDCLGATADGERPYCYRYATC